MVNLVPGSGLDTDSDPHTINSDSYYLFIHLKQLVCVQAKKKETYIQFKLS